MDAPDEQIEVSPSKFDTLPEDIKSRIIRRAGKGTLTKQHRELTLEDRIQDAGTKPFSESELKWFINVRRILAIMFESEKDSIIMYFHSILDKKWGVVTRTGRYRIEITNQAKLTLGLGSREFEKSKIIQFLTGRFDSQTVRDIKLNKFERLPSLNFNVVILDLRSIFIILKHRFEIIVPHNSLVLARKYTQLALDNIVDDFQGVKLFSLHQYLICNALMLDVDIDTGKYPGAYEIDDNILQEITNKCAEIYEILTFLISNMA